MQGWLIWNPELILVLKIYVRVCMRACGCMRVDVCVWMCVCVHFRASTPTLISCVFLCVYSCVCVCVCMCLCDTI